MPCRTKVLLIMLLLILSQSQYLTQEILTPPEYFKYITVKPGEIVISLDRNLYKFNWIEPNKPELDKFFEAYEIYGLKQTLIRWINDKETYVIVAMYNPLLNEEEMRNFLKLLDNDVNVKCIKSFTWRKLLTDTPYPLPHPGNQPHPGESTHWWIIQNVEYLRINGWFLVKDPREIGY